VHCFPLYSPLNLAFYVPFTSMALSGGVLGRFALPPPLHRSPAFALPHGAGLGAKVC
jgi:hypothetical protein